MLDYSYIDDNVWKFHSWRSDTPASWKENRQLPYLYLISYQEKTLGKGTFGKVKLATHLPTG